LQQWVAALNLPFTALALIGLALLLYLLTPENYLTIRQALPGAISFHRLIIATKLFQVYVARYDRYNPTSRAGVNHRAAHLDVSDLFTAASRREIERDPSPGT
jgi:hypothetical protein